MRAAVFWVAILSISIAIAEDAPSTFTAKAPSSRFIITQRWFRPDYVAKNTDCSDADCGWRARLEFADKSKPQATLAAEPEWYSWPADYSISPDEQWILRDQKTGSGENALFLYRVLSDGQVWRLSQHVDDLVWSALLGPLRRTRDDYYHLEVVLAAWDLAAGRVRLKASAVPNDRAHDVIRGRVVFFNLNTHAATPE
jgi:hypothetical protein